MEPQYIEQPQPTRSLADLLPKEIVKPKSLRNQFIDEATARINMERVGTIWKPVTKRAVAIKISHLSDTDIHAFMKKCREGKSFSKVFFGALKVVK